LLFPLSLGCFRFKIFDQGVVEAGVFGPALLFFAGGCFFQPVEALGEVGVGAGAEGEVEGGADQGGAAGFDVVFGGEQVEEGLNGLAGAGLEAGGGVGEILLAHLAQLGLEIGVVVEPAADGAFADAGLTGRGGDGPLLEQGDEGALLAGVEAAGFGLGGGWRAVRIVAGFGRF